MTPGAMAIAAMTVMLWILWSDTIRTHKPAPILYAFRVAIFLVVAGILILNLIRFPNAFAGSGRIMAIIAAAVGILGAGYFARKLVRQGRSPH